ncbi:MAG: formyltetrahydrofolate deformylase [Acidobacteria bacterium]|nr:MAG: formyltetrahydrofolate deformylase [Acidobacteriales bacterium 13_1_40CM_3_55_5]PYV99140.1 MAG: formyltetrahydrofolate deformylase [Acidobacteriota bacterium]PYX12528.1 MAG: formyltetrahydrofolate deformylase [Acidobacteriota bacterium]PYX17380.1 MAG: formyltetrahydrofolate deformylase [Acidobacteriota bacterium]
MKNTAILLISCPDRKGLVASISDFVFRHNGNILHADEHADEGSNLFLMRVEFDPIDFDINLADFAKHFSPIAEKFAMQWRLARSNVRQKMAILVSKYDHCLVDLLYRHKSGELACDIPLVISNHPDNGPIAEFYRIPFFVVPVTKDNKSEAEQKILALLKQHDLDFIVLARYMQILSNQFVNEYPHRIINIHHSFLPAFVGAKPYHQAFTRGVKLIGATSHYVTDVLDDGPIIEQDVVRISHRDSLDDLLQKGRDLEKVVLSRAVRWHIENRVLLYGNKTVVFD